MLKKIIILIIIAAVTIGVWFYHNYDNNLPSQTHNVVLGANGFESQTLNIYKGDTVIFSSTQGKPFWPASDLHPSHTIYSEFDPKRPIEATETWSFKFDKVGTWKYHDHLFSAYRSVIVVQESKKQKVSVASADDCKNSDNKLQCWENLINDKLSKNGLANAFEALAYLYSNESEFAQACHSYAHILGKQAYEVYSKDKKIELSPKTAYCGYGFYHGFMETLLQRGGNINEAREFCAYVGRTLAEQTSDAEGACYHGIGHGTVDGGDPTAWGDAQKMIAPGLKICETVSVQTDQLYRCVTGVYNAIEILSGDSKYKLSDLANDPFGFCPSQPRDYAEPCYTNMLPALMRLTDEDFKLTAQIVAKIPDDDDNVMARLIGYPTRQMVMLSLFYDYIRVNFQKLDYNIKEALSICKTLNSDLRLRCVEGLAGSYMKYGEPEKEYIKGLAFCGLDLLKSDEKDICYKHILNRLRIWYTVENSRTICDSIDASYKKYCNI